MSPEEHYQRGLKLLDNADWCRGHNQPAEAQTDAVVAQAHFGAAAAGTAMRAIELMTKPVVVSMPVAGRKPDPDDVPVGGTDG